jgi:serine/threonine protein kinase
MLRDPDYIEIVKNLPSLKQFIGDYQVEKFVGAGTYGAVVKVRDQQQGKTYAVKLFIRIDMRNRAEIREMIRRLGEQYIQQWEDERQKERNKEAHFLEMLNECKYVVHYVGGGVEDIKDKALFPVRVFYIVTQFMEGGSLTDFLEQKQGSGEGVSFYQSLEIVIQTLHAIEYAAAIELEGQETEIVHRDLCDKNLALLELPEDDAADQPLKIAVLDYGFAKQQDRNARPDGTSYPDHRPTLPPETWGTGAHHRPLPYGVWVDTYSVGIILLDVLLSKHCHTTRSPYVSAELGWKRKEWKEENQEKEFNAFIKGKLDLLDTILRRQDPELPRAQLHQTLARALSYNPQQRYRTAQEMIDALSGIRAEAFYQQVKEGIQDQEYERRKERLWTAVEWDSTDDEVAWNLLGVKFFYLQDVQAAHICFSKAIRIAEQFKRTCPWIYRNRAKLWHNLAKVALSVKEAKFYLKRASEDWIRAELPIPPVFSGGEATQI